MARKVLVFAPHPDDAEYHAGGLLARLIEEGASVITVTVTDGRCGSYELEAEELVATRREEALSAARVLGMEPPIFLGYHDFEVDTLPPRKLRAEFIRLIREYQPEVVVAGDAFTPGEPHPDHRAVAAAASDAILYAGLPRVHPEQLQGGLQPHIVKEKYYFSEYPAAANKIVDISATIEKKLAALAEHKSQVKFLTEGLFREAALAGIDPSALPEGLASDYQAAFNWGMLTSAAEIGRAAGVAYGEAYRYVRFHPLVEAMSGEAR